MSSASFEQGEGRWQGSAEVYDAEGRFAGHGHDARAIRRSLDGRTVEVEVSFTGPFELSGRYTITDFGDHRVYGGPLNYGYAEALGDGLIDANNYWPDIGLSQRLFLMVLPGSDTQLSLALLSRGERLVYAVIGEYSRGSGTDPASAPGSARDQSDHLGRGRGSALIDRPGTWTGELNLVGADGAPAGTTQYREQVEADDDGRSIVVSLAGTGFTDDARIRFDSDGRHRWTGPAGAVGSESLWGGRAVSGNLIFGGPGLRLWRREVARSDGRRKGVLHTWYRGGTRLGTAHGVLHFYPADRAISDG